MRRWTGLVLLGALAGVTAVVVLAALRPGPPPPAGSATPPTGGAVAVSGTGTWRWVGPSGCTPAADPVPVERWSGDSWVGAAVPLRTVTGLSFASTRDGIAVGTTTTCGLGVALTHDGGVTWTTDPAGPALLAAWYVDDVVWGVVRLDGPARLVRYAVQGATLREAETAAPVCDAIDGSPTLTAFPTVRHGLLLCEQDVIAARLLARTNDAGTAWERMTDARPLTGLDGPGPVRDLDVAPGDRTRVWALFPGGRCPEGELRRSTDGGLSFSRLPCPSASGTTLDEVLAVAFSGRDDGVLLGLVDDRPLLLATTDGGASWS